MIQLNAEIKWNFKFNFPGDFDQSETFNLIQSKAKHSFLCVVCIIINLIWAATWQNQQNECAPSEDWDQPGHPPSLIRVFAVRMKKAWVLSYPLSAQLRLWSDWADAQADLSFRLVHSHIVGFVMSRLNYFLFEQQSQSWNSIYETEYDKTNKMTCAPSQDSGKP